MTIRSIASLAHLLRLASPGLPVGAYSYSQGLESAIEAGTVQNEATALLWISDGLRYVVARCEAPIALRLYRAWASKNPDAVRHWNAFFLVTRETAELRAETVQMGYSLKRLLSELGTHDRIAKAVLDSLDPCSFPAAFSFAACAAGVDDRDMLLGLLWAWAENQVTTALKAVPLGQSAGQRLLCALIELLPDTIAEIVGLDDSALSNFAPALAIASCQHETQYSRLFRS